MTQFADSTFVPKIAFPSGREVKKGLKRCRKPPEWMTYGPFKLERNQVIISRDHPP
jgi:hypothetical protein